MARLGAGTACPG